MRDSQNTPNILHDSFSPSHRQFPTIRFRFLRRGVSWNPRWFTSLCQAFTSSCSRCSRICHQCELPTLPLSYAYSRMNQKMFCKEAAMWKSLKHPNILPLLGATISPPQLVSALMPEGDLSRYITNNPSANQIRLVGVDLLAPLVTLRFLPR
jgi:hypothetical protein